LKNVRKARKAVSKVLPTGARMSDAVARVRVMAVFVGVVVVVMVVVEEEGLGREVEGVEVRAEE